MLLLLWVKGADCQSRGTDTKETNLTLPITGQAAPGMKPFESDFVSLLKRWQVPGASLAVSKGGRLVHARGYGWADYEKRQPAKPNSLYRIASISKSITAVAALKLKQEGKLNLDEKVFSILDTKALHEDRRDPRLNQITVSDLLLCTGGWSSKDDGDPLFCPHLLDAAQAAGVASPPSLNTIISYWLDRPLHFAPGTSWGYTNFGYALLGAVIEKRSGLPYEKFVREQVLLPAGITQMRVGKTLEQYPDEVVAYPYPEQPLVKSIYPDMTPLVHWQYGGDFDMDTIAAAAGWIGSTTDLVKFAIALNDGRSGQKSILTAESFRLMLSKPDCPYWKNKVGYFAMGWEVYPVTSGSGYTFSRVGGMPGNVAFLVKRYDGTCWAVAFNSRPRDQDRFLEDAKKMIWSAVNKIQVGNTY